MTISHVKDCILALVLSTVAGCAKAPAPVSFEAMPVQTPSADSESSRRTIVARVLGREIYDEELRDSEGDESDGAGGDNREQRDRLEALILGPLVEKYCKEHDLEPSDDDEILELAREVFGLDSSFWAQLLNDFRNDIASGKLSESNARDAKELITLLENESPDHFEEAYVGFLRSKLDSVMTADADRREYAETLAMIEAEKQMPAAMVKSWKFDKAVFEQYGGIVIFQQMNPFEPVGAYKRWLEAAEQAGDFTILDPELRAAFWDYYNRDWASTPWKVVGDPDPFDRPWWAKESAGEYDQLESMNRVNP